MGCVFSTEQDERKTKQNRDRRPSSQQQQQQQQIRQKQQQQQQRVNGSNGHSRTQQPVPVEKGFDPKTPTRNKTPSPTDCVTPVANNNQSINDGNQQLNDDNTDPQFRRQHFDRTSILRHSKKRKKSSVSNPSSPAPTANTTTTSVAATPSKTVRAETPIKNEIESLPQDDYQPADISLGVAPLDQSTPIEEKESFADKMAINDKIVINENQFNKFVENNPAVFTKPDEPISASARVAALLAGPAKPVELAPEEPVKSIFEEPAKVPLREPVNPLLDEPVRPTFEGSPLPPCPPTPPAPFELPVSVPELFPNDSSVIQAFDNLSDDVLIADVSPLPIPPPTPPPSEIPSMIQDPVTPPPSQKVQTNGNHNSGEIKKNIVVTSTPLAKQLLMMKTSNSGIATPVKPSGLPSSTMTSSRLTAPSAIPVAITPSRPTPATLPTAAAATATPISRIPKLAGTPSANNGSHAKVAKTPSGGKINSNGSLLKTPSGGKGASAINGSKQTPLSNGGGNAGSGRLVLRTRRQVAQELEEQQRNGTRFDKSQESKEENEDCGRLI